ncbi:hypothetical protein TNCV_4011281 [Trichonephila clavipes]|nr:hypothetical protein TNCV_4011281 [Trichonephila clavipes]
MEDDVDAPRSTHASHDGEGSYSYLQAVGNPLVYCYRYTKVSFINSWTCAVSWTACKGALLKNPPQSKPSMTAFEMGS